MSINVHHTNYTPIVLHQPVGAGVSYVDKKDRPIDVSEAFDRFEPEQYEHLGVSLSEVQQGAALVQDAIADLGEPRIYVNRSLSDAAKLLQEGGEFSTIYDAVKDGSLPPEAREEVEAYLIGRTHKEKRLGTLGVGSLEGKTVYGSLGFSKQLSCESWDDGLLSAPGTPAPQHLNAGIALTGGAVTFVLKPEVNRRATFLPSDTYDTHRELPVAREHLPYAVWANIGSKGDIYFTENDGSMAILKLPRDQSVKAVERYLTSDAINRGYMEAQVRGACLDDVERIVLRHEYASVGVEPRFRSIEEGLAEVMRLAREKGIPCEMA